MLGWVARVRQTSGVGQLDDEVLELDEFLALLLGHELGLARSNGIARVLGLLLFRVVRLIWSIAHIVACSPRSRILPRLCYAVHVLVRLACVTVFSCSFDSRLVGLVGGSNGGSPRLLHLLNGLPIVVDNVALVCQVRVEESSKDHNLIVADGDATELRALLILELAIQVDEFPRGLLHVVGLREVDPLDRAQGRAVVDGTGATNGIDERLTEETRGQRVTLFSELRQRLPHVRSD